MMINLSLRTLLLSLPLSALLAWLDWRFVSHLHLGRTMLLWLVSGGLFSAFLSSVRYLCQGNPWRPHQQIRFFLTHIVGGLIAVFMLTGPMWLGARVLQLSFPRPEGWLKPVSLLLALETAVVIYVPIVFFEYFIELNRKTKQLEREHLQAEAARAQSALVGLKAAIHPHFLFNVLNMLVPEIHRNPDKAVDLVDDLSDFLVLSLKMTDRRTVSAEEEFRHARLYLDMESKRIGERLTVDWQLHLDRSDEIQVPPLIILPLIENAIKHGVICSPDPSWIELSCVVDGGWLDVRMANSVCQGETLLQRTTGLGLGVSNLRERLDLFYQGGFSMRSQRLDDRYWVHLRVPLQTKWRKE